MTRTQIDPRATAQCAHPGCANADLPQVTCEYSDGTEIVYCSEHVPDCFCWSCGAFCEGLDEFDFAVEFGNLPGVCETCSHMIRTDGGDFDECGEDNCDSDGFDDGGPF